MLFTSFAVLPISCGKIFLFQEIGDYDNDNSIFLYFSEMVAKSVWIRLLATVRTLKLILRGVGETAARSENSTDLL